MPRAQQESPSVRDLLVTEFLVRAALKRGGAAAARGHIRRMSELLAAANDETGCKFIALRRRAIEADERQEQQQREEQQQEQQRRRRLLRRDAHRARFTAPIARDRRPDAERTPHARSDCSRRSSARSGDTPPDPPAHDAPRARR